MRLDDDSQVKQDAKVEAAVRKTLASGGYVITPSPPSPHPQVGKLEIVPGNSEWKHYGQSRTVQALGASRFHTLGVPSTTGSDTLFFFASSDTTYRDELRVLKERTTAIQTMVKELHALAKIPIPTTPSTSPGPSATPEASRTFLVADSVQVLANTQAQTPATLPQFRLANRSSEN